MASKIVVFALLLSICKVQSQYGCSNSQQTCSSKGQSPCGYGQSQPQTIQFQPSCNNNGVKASPQLQIVPGQNCNLQAIPLSQLLSQSQSLNQQRCQTGINVPPQNFQVTSSTQIPSSCSQCSQPQPCDCNPPVITSPVSTITIPPTSCTTIIDNSLSNSLANALQMMIANEFINSALCNNVGNQDSCSIPGVGTSIPNFELPSFVNTLNTNQYQQYQCSGPSTCYQPDDCVHPKISDWTDILNYLNSQYKEPACDNDYPLTQKGKSASQITKYPQDCYDDQQYIPTCASDVDSCLIEALKAYLGNFCGRSYGSSCGNSYGSSLGNSYGTSCGSSLGNSCGNSRGNPYGNSGGNVAEVVFPDEIPAQLICNYGYVPSTVPVVSFNVQPLGDSNCNYIGGSQC